MYSILHNTSSLLTLATDYANNKGPHSGPRSGSAMSELGQIQNGAIVFSTEGIIETGSSKTILKKYPYPEKCIDVNGSLAMPGLVDCHTHLVFAGNRSNEMLMRLQGATYLDILKSGGGINKTVEATREASFNELKRLGMNRLNQLMKHGTTSVEIKSGYGLNEETEHKLLDVINFLSDAHPLDIVATYLGAHTVPRGADRQDYIRWLSSSSLKDFKKKATYFDIFCEDGAFSAEESQMLLEAAKHAGFQLKAHAGQFNDLGISGIAAEQGAVSIDHLDHISDEQLQIMADHQCIGVLLPGVPFFLKTNIYPNVKRFRSLGTPFAIATDFNPGSCPSFSMLMMISLAVLKCGATLNEAICASTINAAYAMGLGEKVGSLEPGKQADILVLDVETPDEIPYYFGTNLTKTVIKNGCICEIKR